MKLIHKINWSIMAMIFAFFVAACSPSHDDHSEEEHHDHEEHDENTVHLKGDQMELMGVVMGNPVTMNLNHVVQSSGRLEVPPGKRAIVGSIVDGRISEISVMQGDEVRKGQVLARIEHPDIIEMQEQYLVSKSRLNFIRAQYNRNKSLFENEAISEVEFQETESQLNAEEAIFNAFKAKFKLLNIDPNRVESGKIYSSISIVSPIDGNIHLILAQLGSFVNAEMPLFNIVDIGHIHMDLWVFEKDIHKVEKGNLVAFALVDQPDQIYKGNIFSVGRTFEEEPRVLTVHAEIDNKDANLLPGMYINARIVTDSTHGVCIPNDGLITKEGKSYIFKIESKMDEDHEFRIVEVVTGASELGFTMITGIEEEIKSNDMLVTAGAYYLASEMAKGDLEHHH